MLPVNTIRYGTDEFAFNKQVLLKANTAWDMTDMTTCQGFSISFSDTDTSSTGIVFSINGSLKTLDTDGNAVDFIKNENAEEVALYGNTPMDLEALTNVPAFIGNSIIPIIGMVSTEEATEFPKLKIGVRAHQVKDMFERIIETAPKDISYLGEASTIIEITPLISVLGNGTVVVKASLKKENGEWSAYMPIENALFQNTTQIKFQITGSVDIIGTDKAQISGITLKYTTGNLQNNKVTGEISEVYTITENFQNDIGYCQAVIKHTENIDGNIDSYVSFKSAPQTRERIQIGIGDGSPKSFILGLEGVADKHIDHKTIKLYQNNIPVSSFDFNTANSIVSFITIADEPITASYSYGYEKETFYPMLKGETMPYTNGNYLTYYSYMVEDTDKNVSNMKFVLDRTGGTVTEENLGIATGKKQIVVLAHNPEEETIECNADWSYDYATRLFTFVAEAGTSVKVSYEWKANNISLIGFVAGWSLK